MCAPRPPVTLAETADVEDLSVNELEVAGLNRLQVAARIERDNKPPLLLTDDQANRFNATVMKPSSVTVSPILKTLAALEHLFGCSVELPLFRFGLTASTVRKNSLKTSIKSVVMSSTVFRCRRRCLTSAYFGCVQKSMP